MEVSKALQELFCVSQNDYNQGLYNKSLNAIEQAIKLDQKLQKSWDLHGKILFGMLNFRDCQTSLKVPCQIVISGYLI